MSVYQGDLLSIRRQVVKALRLEGNGVAGQGDSDRVDEWINLAYQDVIQATGALQTTGAAVLTNNVGSYTLPSAVAEINLLTILYADGTVSPAVQRVVLETILSRRRTNLAIGAQLWNPVYALVGQNQLELWPNPGNGDSLSFFYTYLPQELALDTDVPLIQEPFGSRVLMYGALVEGARFLKDVFLLSDYETQYQNWMAKFQVWLNRRQGETSMAFRVRGNYDYGQDALVGLARDVG